VEIAFENFTLFLSAVWELKDDLKKNHFRICEKVNADFCCKFPDESMELCQKSIEIS
jgi:hypothetical protein